MKHVGRSKRLAKAANTKRLELVRIAGSPVVDRGALNKVRPGGQDVFADSSLHIFSDVGL